jgi:alkylation response protein AidB-like acyl-CoA dehydrogenase
MNFRLTDQQIALRDSMRAFLDDAHPAARLRELAQIGGRDAAIAQGLAAMGLQASLVPEECGGLGLTLVEGVLIAIELGRANVSEPIADTALVGAPWLARHGGGGTLAAIADGTCRIALAHDINPWIADLDGADAILAADGMQTVLPSPERLESIDPLRLLYAPIQGAGADGLLLTLAALMAAAQMLGAAEKMLAMATDYANVRKQFGQPIGAFQAIKHALATLAARIAFARPVLLRAAYEVQQDTRHADIHVSHAKLAAGDAAILAAETAIQVHGAMGYTYEVDLHFWMKRVWALAGAWGDRNFHQGRLDQAVFDGILPLGPGATFVSEDHHA